MNGICLTNFTLFCAKIETFIFRLTNQWTYLFIFIWSYGKMLLQFTFLYIRQKCDFILLLVFRSLFSTANFLLLSLSYHRISSLQFTYKCTILLLCDTFNFTICLSTVFRIPLQPFSSHLFERTKRTCILFHSHFDFHFMTFPNKLHNAYIQI